MLNLSNKNTIGIGGKRVVYSHPEDENKCVKVVNRHKLKYKILRRKKHRLITYTRPLDKYDRSPEELRLFEKLTTNPNPSTFEYIPRFYGTVETNKGSGTIFEIIKGENLEDYLAENGSNDKIIEELVKIRDNFLKNGIHFSDCRAENFIIQDKGKKGIKIYAIDGFEHNEFIPITKIPFFSRKKVKRIFKRFIREIKNS